MTAERLEDVGIIVPYGKHGNIKMVCPQCGHSGTRSNPRDKSLSVDPDKGVWRCHYCGWKGGLKGQSKGLLGRPFQPKVYKTPAPLPKPDPSRFSPRVASFFADRKISTAALDHFGVTELDGVVKFPYTRDGELINVKNRGAGKKFWMEEGCELVFFGLDQITPDAEQVVITEGEMDALACYTAGITNVVSVPNGASTGSMDYMASAEDLFDSVHTVIIAVDGDEAGQKLESELARRIGKSKCCRVVWPEGCKDANDVLMQNGPGAVRDALANAVEYPVEGANWLSSFLESAIALRKSDQARGTTTGWRNVDEFYTVARGEVTIVTGVPGSGKSEWLDALMVNLAQYNGWSFAVNSPENAPGELHFTKLASKYWDKPYWPGPTQEMSDEQLEQFANWADHRFLVLDPESPSLPTLLSIARGYVYRHGIQGMVIDPWNRLDHTRESGVSLTEYTRDMLAKAKAFAVKYDLHLWLMAHPRIMHRDREGKTPVPTPYDISDSAHFFNMADNCITVNRDKMDPAKPVEIHVQKVRFQRIGKVGVALLGYNPVTGRYRDYDGVYEP